jgi:UDP-3-O-[3-hydroxymyristoyl] glucosamine N-acyltransferase
MGNQLIAAVKASSLASALGLAYTGRNRMFDHVLPLSDADDGALSFSAKIMGRPREDAAVVIAPPGNSPGHGVIIEAENPRLAFARALNWLNAGPGFMRSRHPPEVHRDARISPTAVIANGVKIGRGTIVNPFVVIGEGVTIGEDCVIKSGSIIGEDGFGFERDKNGLPVRLLHLGTVAIGNNVEIGSLNTVCRGMIRNTVLEDDVKTDDHVHIAHNCYIGRGALLTACVELSGGVQVGRYAWVGPNSSVIQKIQIGDHGFVGIGSNVTQSVAPGDTVAGNPARVLRRADAE